MDDKDYSDDCSDAFRYLAQGLYNDMEEYDPNDHYPMAGFNSWLKKETEKYFPDTAVDLSRYMGVDWGYIESESKTCSHSWKTYHGFTEQYDFCEKCDTKK